MKILLFRSTRGTFPFLLRLVTPRESGEIEHSPKPIVLVALSTSSNRQGSPNPKRPKTETLNLLQEDSLPC